MRSRKRDRSTLVLLRLLEFWQQWRWRRRPISHSLYKPYLVLSIYGSLPGVFSLSLSLLHCLRRFNREKTAWRASTRLFCMQIVLSCSSFLIYSLTYSFFSSLHSFIACLDTHIWVLHNTRGVRYSLRRSIYPG